MDKLSVIRCVGEQLLQCVLCFTPLFSLLALQLYKPAKQECSLNATPRKDRDKNSLTDPFFHHCSFFFSFLLLLFSSYFLSGGSLLLPYKLCFVEFRLVFCVTHHIWEPFLSFFFLLGFNHTLWQS